MKRTARERRTPNLPKIEKIELNEHNFKMRLIGVILLLVIGLGAIGYFIFQLLQTETGWREIKTDASAGITCGDDFIFRYDIGASGASASLELRELTDLYTQAAKDAYHLFHAGQSFEDVVNPHTISAHPNEALTVDPLLYDAFALLERAGSRALYLAPVYAQYDAMFNCEYDSLAENFDPLRTPEAADYISQALTFVRDPEAVSLELLGENRVILHVSDAYLAFADAYEITSFLDFFYLKNAFIIDYFAQTITARGYRRGCISSVDGYARNLGESGVSYSYNFYQLTGSQPYVAARLDYTAPLSIVNLRSFPIGDYGFESLHCYLYENGEIRTAYISERDGLCHAAVENLVGYSDRQGCADVLLALLPHYLGDTFDPAALMSLSAEGIGAVWCKNRTLTDTLSLFTIACGEGYHTAS